MRGTPARAASVTRYRPRLRAWLGGCVLAGVLLGAAFWWADRPLAPGTNRTIRVYIPPGSSLQDIAETLRALGVIRSPWAFRLLAEGTGAAASLRAGEYDLSPGMSPRQIIRRLVRGEVVTYAFTIPEGYTVAQIADLLAEKGLADKERFLAAAARAELAPVPLPLPGRVRYALEGYLFPDTYRVPRGMEERELIALMVRRFREVFAPLEEKAARLGLSVAEAVTLASIVEKETADERERPLVAGVFWNRLRQGMLLQADPTVLYALNRTEGPLLRSELEVDSPYNTYRYAGLPPGPIANPGATALRAAVEPLATDYLYFVARGDGTHHFSRTFAEHHRAVRRYRGR